MRRRQLCVGCAAEAGVAALLRARGAGRQVADERGGVVPGAESGEVRHCCALREGTMCASLHTVALSAEGAPPAKLPAPAGLATLGGVRLGRGIPEQRAAGRAHSGGSTECSCRVTTVQGRALWAPLAVLPTHEVTRWRSAS